jgi:hypothetical protein
MLDHSVKVTHSSISVACTPYGSITNFWYIIRAYNEYMLNNSKLIGSNGIVLDYPIDLEVKSLARESRVSTISYPRALGHLLSYSFLCPALPLSFDK